MSARIKTTVDDDEIAKFSAMADEWWDKDGKFKPLHLFNPVRIEYIKDKICKHYKCNSLKNISILDIGCGGGLLSEPLARLGAEVTAIDASEKNIKIASVHAEKEGLDIDYRNTTPEELDKNIQFDVVLNMEILEHVADVSSFVEASCALLKPEGIMFSATMNRTVKSFAFGIIGAEYILNWLPKGTHDWNRFLKPSEVEKYLCSNKVSLKEIQGVTYNPLLNKWSLSDDISVNYILLAVKNQKE